MFAIIKVGKGLLEVSISDKFFFVSPYFDKEVKTISTSFWVSSFFNESFLTPILSNIDRKNLELDNILEHL